MKKIIKPLIKEEAVYYSDFSGKPFDECGPPVELKIDFNYGSKYDGSQLKFDLTDEEFQPLLNLIKNLVTEDYKSAIKKRLNSIENSYEDSMQMRDWMTCDMTINNIWLLRDFLNLKDEEDLS